MDSKKKSRKFPQWEIAEKKLLLESMKEQLRIIENLSSGHVLKERAWTITHARFNTINLTKRSLGDLKAQWSLLKNGATKKYINFNGFKRPSGARNPDQLILKAEQVDLTDADDDEMPPNESNTTNETMEILDLDTALKLSTQLEAEELLQTQEARLARVRNNNTHRINKSAANNKMDKKLFELELHRKKLKMNYDIHMETLKSVILERQLKLKYIAEDRQRQLEEMKEVRIVKLSMMKEEWQWKKELYKLQRENIVNTQHSQEDDAAVNVSDAAEPSSGKPDDLPRGNNAKRIKLGSIHIDWLNCGLSGFKDILAGEERKPYVQQFEDKLKLIKDNHSLQTAKDKIDVIMQEAISGVYELKEELQS